MATPYPQPAFHFIVECGTSRVGFTEVSGLNFTVEPIEYREGNEPTYHVRKLAGMHKFGNITLKRGTLANDNELYTWFTNTNLSVPDRRTVTIKLLDETHTPILTYTCLNAWITKFDGTSFKSTGNDLAIESAEMVCESWTATI